MFFSTYIHEKRLCHRGAKTLKGKTIEGISAWKFRSNLGATKIVYYNGLHSVSGEFKDIV